MGKYENAKFLVIKKARKNYLCVICKKDILSKEHYYRESLGLINPGPNIELRAYCIDCAKKSKLPK